MKKLKIALVRGKFLNKSEMQSYEPLVPSFDITAFASRTSIHTDFSFPVTHLLSPVDLPDFPYKMSILNRLFTDAQYLLKLEANLKGYDIAHCAETYYHYTHQCLTAKKKGYVKKVISTVYENIPHANEKIRGRRKLKEQAYKEVDLFLAVTKPACDALLNEGVDKKKIKILYPGVDIDRFKPKKKKQGDITILYVGRLEKEKGIYDAVNGFYEASKKHDNIKLNIAGKGSQKNKVQNFVNHLGISKKVKFSPTPYDKLHTAYQKADVFIAPSHDTSTWQEQFGYMLAEAMASGLPLLTTNAGAIPEVVGDSGIIVPQSNTKQLTHHLIKLIETPDLRKTLGKKARTRAEKFFDSQKVAKDLRSIYTSIV